MVLATPMFSAIKKKYPQSQIDVICSEKNFLVLQDNPHIGKKFIYKKKPLSVIKLIFSLRARNYDCLIDPKPHYSTESATFARIVRAKDKIGFVKDKSSPFNLGGLVDTSGKHFATMCLESLEHLGINASDESPIPQLFVADQSKNHAQEIMGGEKKKALINISAGKPSRMFSHDAWTGFLSGVDAPGWDFYISYSPGDVAFANKLMSEHPDLIDIRSSNLSDVVASVSLCGLVITPDTALVHIASAFNRPIITAFSSWEDNFKKFEPLSDTKQIIRTQSDHRENSLKSVTSSDLISAWKKISTKL